MSFHPITGSANQITLIILFLISSVTVYGQRSYRYENFGNQSVLLNGNVTGSVTDLGGVFYNPARLALVENPKFSVEGRFYERTDVSVDDFLGAGVNINNKQFNGLPGLLVAVATIGKEKFYYSFMLRNRIGINSSFDTGLLNSENTEGLSPGFLFNADASVSINLREEWFGLSWAKKLSDNFSLGISTFLSFYNYSGGDAFDFILTEDEVNQLQFRGELNYSQASTGLFTKVSAAWNLKPLTMGLTIDLPYIEFRDDSSLSSKEMLADNVTGGDILTINQFGGLVAKRKVPLGINFGVGIPVGKSTIHLNTDWHAGLKRYTRINIPPLESSSETETAPTATESLNPVLNFGLGTEIYLNKSINAFLSFTTDNSPLDSGDQIFEGLNAFGESNILTLDYLHFGAGLSIKLKSFGITIGAVNSRASGDFERAFTLPIGVDNLEDRDFNVIVDRWRFLIGFNIPGVFSL